MNQIVHLSRYFPTSREVRIVQVWAIVHNVISFKQVIQGKHPALLVLAVSDYEAMLTISNMWLEVFQASPSHPHCQCFCRSDAHPSASAGRASKVKIWRFLLNCVIYWAQQFQIWPSGRHFKTDSIIGIAFVRNDLKCTLSNSTASSLWFFRSTESRTAE